jgi:replication factor C subunit 1
MKLIEVRKIVDDSDDEDYEQPAKKATPKKPTPKKSVKKSSPRGEATTASDYFASSGKTKPTRSTPTKPRSSTTQKDVAVCEVVIRTPKGIKNKRAVVEPKPLETPVRASKRRKPTTSYAEYRREDDDAFLEDDIDGGDDIFAAEFKKDNGVREDDSDSDAIFVPQPKSTQDRKRSTVRAREVITRNGRDVVTDDTIDDDFIVPDEDDNIVVSKTGKKRKQAAPTANRKRKSLDLEDDNSEEDYGSPKSKRKGVETQTAQKKPPAKKARVKKIEPEESRQVQEIFDNIPTVRPPSPPPKSDAPTAFNFRAQAQRSGPPPGAGSKEIPIGAENCLAGLTFVFTGILDTLSREDGVELVKRYGGKVTGAPSSKTSFVILGNDAGPKKLEVIRKNNIKTINEDGLCEMIRRLPANGGDGKAAKANEIKKEKEEMKVREMAAEIDREERRLGVSTIASGGMAGKRSTGGGRPASDSRLWTVKYAPTSMNQICGNKGQVEKLQKWLRNWPTALKSNFKKPGPDATGNQRAVIIHGPPGIGKTTAAHLAAKIEGYDIVESNASDTRSKKLIEAGLRGVLDNTSLLGYFAADRKEVEGGKKKLVLIMDEVDGMSAGDRGGVGALAQVCKKTQIPVILICNDRKLPKMRPFDYCTLDMPFRRPTVNDIRSRVMTICYREGLKLSPQVIDALVEGTHGDIRQIINMISTAKLDQATMDFDQGKSMSKAWEKHIILKPWDIAGKLLTGHMFASHSNATLNDKIELYFNDHEFSYLMIQENYLKPFPAIANQYSGRARNLKALELADMAAESISDGDLVDAMIHGTQQHWSLMPIHAVFSTVRPSSFMSGSMTGGQQVGFTSWLGNNSKKGRTFARSVIINRLLTRG